MAKTDRIVGSVVDQIILPAGGVADLTAPTALELNTGVRVECDLVPGTLSHPRTPTFASIRGACETESGEIAASITNGSASGTYYYETPDGGATWAAFDDTTRPAATQIEVICRAGFSGTDGAAAATDVVEVREIQVAARQADTPDPDEAQRFTATWSVLSCGLDVAVA